MDQMSKESRSVLRALLSKKMLRGRDLLKRTHLTEEKLIEAVVPLVDDGLVETSESALDPERVSTSRYYLPPSAVKFVERIMSRKW